MGIFPLTLVRTGWHPELNNLISVCLILTELLPSPGHELHEYLKAVSLQLKGREGVHYSSITTVCLITDWEQSYLVLRQMWDFLFALKKQRFHMQLFSSAQFFFFLLVQSVTHIASDPVNSDVYEKFSECVKTVLPT